MDILVREARPEDKDAVIEFTKNTWERGDYIPMVWDSWINDSHGILLIADYKGEPIGLLHIRFMPDNSAWLEGLRVHPEYRRKGVATILNSEAIKMCISKGIRVFRGAIFEWNVPSLKLATQKLGFRILESKWYVLRKEIEKETKSSLLKPKAINVNEFWNRIRGSSYFSKTSNLIFYGWAWFKGDLNSLNRLIERDNNVRFFEVGNYVLMVRIRKEPRYGLELNIFDNELGLRELIQYSSIIGLTELKYVKNERYLMIAVVEDSKIVHDLSGESQKYNLEKLFIFEGIF